MKTRPGSENGRAVTDSRDYPAFSFSPSCLPDEVRGCHNRGKWDRLELSIEGFERREAAACNPSFEQGAGVNS
jgi:hypothetical protein